MVDEDDRDPSAVAGTLLTDFLRLAREDGFQRELTRRLDDDLVAEIPELAAIRADLDASTHDLLAEFFRNIELDPSGQLEIPPAVLGLARTVALRGHDIGVLLRAYRIGQRLAWTELNAILATEVPDPGLRLDVLTVLFEKMSLELERIVDESIAVFSAERDRWLTGALARKTDTIQALLSGEAVDADEATRVLGHRLHRHQLALLVWDATPDPHPLDRLEGFARAAAASLGSPPPLTLPDGTRSLQVWLNVTPDQDVDLLERLVSESPAGLHAAAGRQSYGASGFRTSHRQAGLARRVALASRPPPRLTRYADVALVGAFLDDTESMRDLVAGELGALGRPGETNRRLRETALAVLRAGGSAREAAVSLGVHKNTVLYRLPQIEELLTHPLDERRLPLEMALEIVERLGDGVLP